MSGNGQNLEATTDVLRWPGRVVSALELSRQLNGHRRLLVPLQAVVTPAALEELRARGIIMERESEPQESPAAKSWGVGQDRMNPTVQSALEALERDGLHFYALPAGEKSTPALWARQIAASVAGGTCAGGVVFCHEPATVCCIANKVAGLRAAAVTSVAQLGRALRALAPNLVAVEMPGRTFFEVRQILREACGCRACPEGVVRLLEELDGHAHR
jgi:hypothetical protein